MKQLFVLIAITTNLCLASEGAASKSVYEVSNTRDIAIVAVGTLGALLPYAFASTIITRRCPCPNDVNGFDRGAIGNNSHTAIVLSDVTMALAVLGPPFLDYLDLGFSREFAEDMIVYAQTIAVSSALVSITKVAVQRPLPRVYAAQAPELTNTAEGYRSFYSGHTTTTVAALAAAAVTMNLRYHSGVWPWVVVGTLGGGVAVMRVLAGVHFPSDVLVGAAAGVAVGTIIPLLHRRGSTNLITLAPIDGGARLVGIWSL